MNQVIENINTRASVRDYKDEKVPDEVIQNLLKLGFRAPNAMNRQSLAFAIIENKEKAKKYSDIAKTIRLDREKMKSKPNERVINMLSNEDYNIFFNSPVQIFILSSPRGIAPVEDGLLAAQNMMLAAHSMGYGMCCIGFAQGLGLNQEFRSDLNIPEDHSYVIALTLGKPAKNTPVKDRKDVNILGWVR
ncbi:MAG TPA: nitroreductase family protein [Candidatus Methanomethylophilaceae archaeon]|nr:nitroreductase family protein [Candidatus Methanomethylophilaceae archaeon]